MFKILYRGVKIGCVKGFGRTTKRYYLSNAYKCSEAWSNRLKHPICQKIEIEKIYYKLDLDFQAKRRINILDVDFLATSLTDMQYQDELEDVLTKLRETPECVLLPERTNHAVIRLYADHGSKQDIFNILSNRLVYGIFPDNYLCNLMLDKYLREEDFVSAVKIAVLQMLQEDTEHPITNALILYSCFKYLTSSQIWSLPKNSEEEDDGGGEGDDDVDNDEDDDDDDDDDEDKEVVTKVRVQYLKNPYYDDHFDIQNVNHLIGKTLWMYGISAGGELGASSQLVGYVLHEKYEKAADLLQKSIKDKSKLHLNAVEMAKDFLSRSPNEQTVSPENEESKESQKSVEKESETKSDDSLKTNVTNLLKKLNKKNLISESVLEVSLKAVKAAVEAHEEKDILHQTQLYQKWEKERENDLEKELNRSKLENLKKEIEKTKKDLKEEEEKLFFFDKEDELEMKIQEKEKEKESVVFYKEKTNKSGDPQNEYISPDVHQRKRSE